MELLDIKNISSSWGIEISNFKKLSERATLVFTTDEEKFIIKRKDNLEHFNSELKLIGLLRSKNFFTQFPLYNKQGELSVPYQNSNFAIYNYLEGSTFGAEESLLNPKIPNLLGETIANLNKIMASADFLREFPSKDLYQLVYGFAVKEIIKVDPSEELQNVYQQVEEEIKNLVNILPKQLIHRDAHIHNIIFDNNSLSGVIDYEIVEVNVNIFDICYCSTSILSEVFTNEKLRGMWINFVANLVCTYNQVNPLSDSEKGSIWHVMLCIQSIFMAYFSSNEDIYKINKAMFQWIYENRNNLERKILLNVN
ncbi:phosphotransferase (plasmid) [Cytobacillus oceanisediminis]|uniref:phosphotransferase enzyme family protein n=1 Tax=Cytobacillus oceanisediminis TaxID=665099 RepID=UPI001863AD54|nr:phosphotransferase [Cytobacillus oceanisediminis]QOK30101.1 phosphotransferase [Cytobacillus oceanisediminis]